jgi:hypothetical protein
MKGVATLLLICLNQSRLFAQVDSAWFSMFDALRPVKPIRVDDLGLTQRTRTLSQYGVSLMDPVSQPANKKWAP